MLQPLTGGEQQMMVFVEIEGISDAADTALYAREWVEQVERRRPSSVPRAARSEAKQARHPPTAAPYARKSSASLQRAGASEASPF